jgi:hypothetical protein
MNLLSMVNTPPGRDVRLKSALFNVGLPLKLPHRRSRRESGRPVGSGNFLPTFGISLHFTLSFILSVPQ